VLDMEGDEDASKIVVSLIREKFDEVSFYNITELKFRRSSFWAPDKTIDIKYQGGSISFTVCAFLPWGVRTMAEKTQEVFRRIQNGMNTYRRS